MKHPLRIVLRGVTNDQVDPSVSSEATPWCEFCFVSCHNSTFDKQAPDKAQVYCWVFLFCYLPWDLEINHCRTKMNQDSYQSYSVTIVAIHQGAFHCRVKEPSEQMLAVSPRLTWNMALLAEVCGSKTFARSCDSWGWKAADQNFRQKIFPWHCCSIVLTYLNFRTFFWKEFADLGKRHRDRDCICNLW